MKIGYSRGEPTSNPSLNRTVSSNVNRDKRRCDNKLDSATLEEPLVETRRKIFGMGASLKPLFTVTMTMADWRLGPSAWPR
jgi:hypothetical protein